MSLSSCHRPRQLYHLETLRPPTRSVTTAMIVIEMKETHCIRDVDTVNNDREMGQSWHKFFLSLGNKSLDGRLGFQKASRTKVQGWRCGRVPYGGQMLARTVNDE